MKYFFAIFLPPVAVLLCGKPGSFLLNLILTICGWVPGIIHAIIVVGSYNADKRTDRIVSAITTSASGPPPLPQTPARGRSMTFVLIVGAAACFFGFLVLASLIAGLQSKFPAKTDDSTSTTKIEPTAASKPKKAASNKEPTPASPNPDTPSSPQEAQLASAKPEEKPAITKQSWTSKDGRVIEASFVKLDGESVVIEKDGKMFTVPFSNLEAWSVVQAKKLGGALPAQSANKKPSAPVDLPQAKLDAYMALVNSDRTASKIVESVSAEQSGERWTATITLSNVWHLRNKQLRLQDAQTLWKAWAVVASKTDPDKARIKLIDLNGNELGGSRLLAGSLIWVQD